MDWGGGEERRGASKLASANPPTLLPFSCELNWNIKTKTKKGKWNNKSYKTTINKKKKIEKEKLFKNWDNMKQSINYWEREKKKKGHIKALFQIPYEHFEKGRHESSTEKLTYDPTGPSIINQKCKHIKQKQNIKEQRKRRGKKTGERKKKFPAKIAQHTAHAKSSKKGSKWNQTTKVSLLQYTYTATHVQGGFIRGVSRHQGFLGDG